MLHKPRLPLSLTDLSYGYWQALQAVDGSSEESQRAPDH